MVSQHANVQAKDGKHPPKVVEEEEGEESDVKEEESIAEEEHHTKAIVINKSVLLRIPARNPLRGQQNQVNCFLIEYCFIGAN